LSRKISAFAPILWLKNDAEFTWGEGGADQQRAFDDIKKYLSSPLVMKAPITWIPFRLYVTAEDAVIGAVLMQVLDAKEHIITYLRRHLIDVKARYSFIEKLYLSWFYACFKFRHYLL
jgi:hypothetical protein